MQVRDLSGTGVRTWNPLRLAPGCRSANSSIGLVQQEAAIRKQMWQENLAYQLQSIQFQRQALEISKQELALSKAAVFGAQREYNLGERGANRAMQLRQREWSAEDFSIRVERMGITQEWAMEDLQRSRRYATGRERVDIERNIQRTMVSQSLGTRRCQPWPQPRAGGPALPGPALRGSRPVRAEAA